MRGSSGEAVCCRPNLHLQLCISPPPPLICNSFTFLARVLSARDVVPMGSGGCVPSVSLPDVPGDTFQHLGEILLSSSGWIEFLLIRF